MEAREVIQVDEGIRFKELIDEYYHPETSSGRKGMLELTLQNRFPEWFEEAKAEAMQEKMELDHMEDKEQGCRF